VVAISDGDTIILLDRSNTQHKVRLHGIDAPEKGQAFGERSKENLSHLAFGIVTSRRTATNATATAATVCKIMLGSTDVNLEQIRAGMAWWYREYAKEQIAEDQAIYSSAERDAHARRVGLWNHAAPIPPWLWRKSERALGAARVSSR
jgi:endonuclease YncB( thermonuclease family)